MQMKKLIPKVFWYINPTCSFSSKYEQMTEKPTERFSITIKPKMLAKMVPRPTAANDYEFSY